MDSTEKQELYDKFDAKWYAEMRADKGWNRTVTEYLSEWMYSVFSTGTIKGDKLLDVGTGPNINSVLYAEPYFREIYLSDISINNISFLNEWRNGEHSELLRHFFERAIKLQGSSQTPEEKEEVLKSKIKDVCYCDIVQDNPMRWSHEHIGQVDAVTASWALAAAAEHEEQYKRALKNVISLIKPGGNFILMDICSTTQQYYVNNICFPGTKLKDKEMINLIETAFTETSFLSKQNSHWGDGVDVYLFNIVAKV